MPYSHDLAVLVFNAVYSKPVEKITPSRPLTYIHWNWYAGELWSTIAAYLGILNSLTIPCNR
jgi:hypothetical protein